MTSTRKPGYSATMEVALTVTVDWPFGVPLDEDRLKQIAANAAPQHYETDVSASGPVVWAKVHTDASDEDVCIAELVDLYPDYGRDET